MVQEPGEAGVHQGHFDVPADAGLVDGVQRSEHADGGVVAGEHVDDGHTRPQGPFANLSGEVHDAGHALDGEVETGEMCCLAGGSERP